MTFGSLFAGLGGFDLAFERAGMTPAWQVEIDRDCNRVLAHHWPDVPKFDDVRKVGRKQLKRVDVISFGSPCQDLSVAGKRAGMAGERSGLFFEAIRIVRELRPAFAIWENVPGAFSSHAGRDFLSAVRAFHELGARDVAWRTLDARYWGVAQRRRRVFLVADFRGERAGQILFEPEGCSRNPAAGSEAAKDIAGTIGSCTPGAGHRNDLDRCGAYVSASTLRGRQHREGVSPPGRGGEDDANLVLAPTLTAQYGEQTGRDAETNGSLIAFGGNDTRGPLEVATAVNACGTASGRQDFESETFIVNAAESCAKQSHARQSDTARCLDQTGGFAANQGGTVVSQPLRSNVYNNSDPGMEARMHIQQGMAVRRLTPTECCRLQGLPDDWLDLDPPLSDSAKYRLIGNSVAVPVVEWIGRRIMTAVRAA